MRHLALIVGLAACAGEDPTCGANIAEDLFVISAIDAYNATLASGAATWTCPGGGAATVTGTVTPMGTGTTLRDFTVTFADCFDSTAATELTLTGAIHHRGTWVDEDTAAYCESCTLTADALHVTGKEEACEMPALDRDCTVAFTVTGTSAQVVASYDGSACGVTFP